MKAPDPRPAPDGSRVLISLRVAATPERAFEAFTGEIARWWKPDKLFRFTDNSNGSLHFYPGAGGRLVERFPDGSEFTIGEISLWNPPTQLALSWRHANFEPDQKTELHVGFESVGEHQTKVTVEHFGWDALPAEHASRHGFPLGVFQLRFAEWWRSLLESMIPPVNRD